MTPEDLSSSQGDVSEGGGVIETIDYRILFVHTITNHAIVMKISNSCEKLTNGAHSPLLLPSGPRRMVHSSIEPKVVNS